MAITTVTKALKKLYKAIVGEETTKNDPTKIICDLADNWPGGGGGGSWTVLTEESVTTTIVEDSLFAGSDDLIYSERITADIIKVTFNGTEYTCNKRIDNGDSFYGAEWSYATDSYDFSQYPFEITSLSDANFLYTETAGTYQVKIEAPQAIAP